MGVFRALKKVITGEVVKQIDTAVQGGLCTMSLRLKRNRASGDHYVVLAGLSSGNYQYFPMDKNDFEQFAKAVETIGESLRQASQKE